MSVTKNVLLSGNATFTVVPPPNAGAPKSEFTFKVEKSRPNAQYPVPGYFLKYFTGSKPVYIGKVDGNGNVNMTPKSELDENTYVVKLAKKVIARIWDNQVSVIEKAGWKLYQEGGRGDNLSPSDELLAAL